MRGLRALAILAALAVGGVALLAANLDTAFHLLLVSQATAELRSYQEVSEELGGRTEWFDDYYSIEYLDERTIAIGEPRYWQQNISYLVLGDEKALLFDTGPGIRDISRLVAATTDLPVTVVCSHYHYDHAGSLASFDRVLLGRARRVPRSSALDLPGNPAGLLS